MRACFNCDAKCFKLDKYIYALAMQSYEFEFQPNDGSQNLGKYSAYLVVHISARVKTNYKFYTLLYGNFLG